MTWQQGQFVTAAALNAAFAACYPAGNVSTYSGTLLSQTSSAAWLAALGFPSGTPGAANGLATLDATGKLTASQVPTSSGAVSANGSVTSAPAAAAASLIANAPSSSYGATVVFQAGSVAKFSEGIATGSDPYWGLYNYGQSAYAITVDYLTNKVAIPQLNTAGLVTNDSSGNLGTVAMTGTGSAVMATGATLVNLTITGTASVPTQSVNDNSTKPASTAYVQAQIAAQVTQATPTPWAITGGLPSAMSGASTTAAITVTAFTASDATASVLMSKGTSTSWAVSNGNAANGYAGGTTLPNSSTIHMYACQGGSGTCLYASTTFGMAAASAPSGYNSYVRRLFSFNTSSSGAPIAYTPDEVYGGAMMAYLAAYAADVSASTTTSASRTLYTTTVPTGAKMEWMGNLEPIPSTDGNFWITSPDEPDTAPTASNTANAPVADVGGYGSYYMLVAASRRRTLTNASGQLGVRASSTSVTFNLTTTGFVDFRRS